MHVDDAQATVRIAARRLAVWSLSITALLIAAYLSTRGLEARARGGGWALALFDWFDANREASIPTLYSQILLWSVACTAWTIARHERLSDAAGAAGWRRFAALFGVLAVDEGAELHEHLIVTIKDFLPVGPDELLYRDAWILYAVAVAGGVILLVRSWMRALPVRTSAGLAIGIGVLATGAVGVEIARPDLARALAAPLYVFASIEEALEMVGATIVLYVVALYAQDRGVSTTVTFSRPAPTPARRVDAKAPAGAEADRHAAGA